MRSDSKEGAVSGAGTERECEGPVVRNIATTTLGVLRELVSDNYEVLSEDDLDALWDALHDGCADIFGYSSPSARTSVDPPATDCPLINKEDVSDAL